mgnify:CR=1 FL=1
MSFHPVLAVLFYNLKSSVLAGRRNSYPSSSEVLALLPRAVGAPSLVVSQAVDGAAAHRPGGDIPAHGLEPGGLSDPFQLNHSVIV